MDIQFRHITINDYTRVLELLTQLTHVGSVSQEEFTVFVSKLNSEHIVICCEYYDIEADTTTVIAMGTVLIENKLIHTCGKVAHIEDVVVDKNFRNHHVCTKLIEHLVSLSKDKDVYKINLNCSENNQTFYENCGFHQSQIQTKMIV